MTRFTSIAAALAALAIAAAAQNAVAATCPIFEVAAVAPAAETNTQTFPLRGGGSITVRVPALVSSRDVVGADVSAAEGQLGVDVRVGPDAAERVRVYTAGHVGERLAIVVDGRPPMVMRILDPIARDGFWISPMEPEAAKQLASGLRDCVRNPSR